MATTTADERQSRDRRAERLWRIGLPIVAGALTLGLALLTLGARDLWYDESFSITSTNQLWASLVRRSGSMGLYYALLTPWSKVSLDPFWLRLPSALFAAVAVGFASRFAFVHFGRTAGTWTAVLLVPMFGVVRYAQEARSYSLVMLLAVVSWSLTFRLAQRSSRGLWIWWGACGAALVYSHPIAGLIPASQLLAWRGRSPSLGVAIRDSAPGWATSGILLLPMVATFGLRTSAAPGWVPPLGWGTLGEGLSMVAGPRAIPQALVALALLLASWRIATTNDGRDEATWQRRCMLLWLWVTPVVVLLVSIRQPVFIGRYLIAALPAVAIVIAVAMSDLRPATLRTGAGLVLLVSLVPGMVILQGSKGHEWSKAIDAIESELRSSERHGIAFNYGEVRQPFELNATGRPILSQTVPVGPSDPWGSNLRYYDESTLDDLAVAAANVDVLWEVAQIFDADPEPLHPDRFEPVGFCLATSRNFSPGIVVTRFEPCP
jgi:mannosyltransferase